MQLLYKCAAFLYSSSAETDSHFTSLLSESLKIYDKYAIAAD